MSAPETIRPARRADLSAIVRLLADDPLGAGRERWAEPLPDPYRRAWDAIERDPNNDILVAEAGGAIVGCLQLTLIPGLSHTGTTRAQVEAVRIAASHRGSGLGGRLIDDAIKRARAAGCGMVQLTTDKSRTDAHRFYERRGFVASHEGMKLKL